MVVVVAYGPVGVKYVDTCFTNVTHTAKSPQETETKQNNYPREAGNYI